MLSGRSKSAVAPEPAKTMKTRDESRTDGAVELDRIGSGRWGLEGNKDEIFEAMRHRLIDFM